MFKFLFTIFLVFVLFVFIFGFSILRLLFGGLFGTRPKQNQTKTNQQTQSKTQTRQSSPSPQKKIIDSNEGEYVEYEEVKD
jgi:cytoskeletal protein RodZ